MKLFVIVVLVCSFARTSTQHVQQRFECANQCKSYFVQCLNSEDVRLQVIPLCSQAYAICSKACNKIMVEVNKNPLLKTLHRTNMKTWNS